jgi:hypothetical protein
LSWVLVVRVGLHLPFQEQVRQDRVGESHASVITFRPVVAEALATRLDTVRAPVAMVSRVALVVVVLGVAVSVDRVKLA